MTEEVAEILRLAGQNARDAGSSYVGALHVTPEQLDALAEDALAFLRGRQGEPIGSEGWTRLAGSKAGLMPYWVDLTGWQDGEGKRFRPLRRDVYDRLEARCEIVKPPGQGSSIDISPPTAAMSSLAGRLTDVSAAVSANEIDPVGYEMCVDMVSLTSFLLSTTTSSTTLELMKLDLLALSLEHAAQSWLDVPADAREAGRARLDFWSKT